MVQFNYPSDGIGRKARKKYTFANFRGVDTSVAPINVDPVRAVESTNFVDRNGVLHKRYGWEQVYQFDGEINGFWELALGSRKHTICYSGSTFYVLDENDGWSELYASDNLVSRRTACYASKDSAYFIGCGDLLVYRYYSETGKYQMFRVVDDTMTYIPTTTAHILSQKTMETGREGQYVRDSVNLLTGWRMNTLRGEVVPENGELVYKLDGAPSFKQDENKAYHPIKITYNNNTYETATVNESAELEVGKGDDITDRNAVLNIGELPVENAEDFPDIAYDAISKEDTYSSSWVFCVAGRNGKYGLRWYREKASDFAYNVFANGKLSIYRVYTLYFIAEDNSTIPVARRIYQEYQPKIPDGQVGISLDAEYDSETQQVRYSVKRDGTYISFPFQCKVQFTFISDEGEGRKFAATVKFDALEHQISGSMFQPWGNVEYKVGEDEDSMVASRAYYYEPIAGGTAVTQAEADVLYDRRVNTSTKTISFRPMSYLNGVIVESFVDGYDKFITFNDSVYTFDYDGMKGTIDSAGKLTVTKWNIKEDSSTANVTVEFYVDSDKSDWITTCKYSTLYGVNGETDRLFLSNGDDASKRNVIFFSEMDDFSYFPDTFTKAVGGTTNEVQGFLRLANGSMAALKTVSPNEATVFVFSGEYMTGYYDVDELEEYTLPKFSTSGVSTTQGIVAPYACSNLADDSMFLSQNGVYALELSQGTDSQRFAKERSLPINNLLKECNSEDLRNACGITHENKYYLAVKHYKQTSDKSPIYSKKYYEKTKEGYIEAISINLEKGMSQYYEAEDVVYIADAHYSYAPLGAMADAPSYEWYPISYVPVRTWILLNGELYFGTDDGRICKFVKDNYYDIEKRYFANNPKQKEAKSISQSTVSALTSSLDSEEYNADINSDGLLDTFAIDSSTEIYDQANGDYDRDTIVFVSGALYGNVYEESKNLIGVELYIKKLYDENGDFTGNIQVLYDEDGDPIEFSEAVNLVAEIRKRRIVKASRTTPTFDFGMPDYLKTLESFTVVMNGTQGGPMVVDILTRNNIAKSNTAHTSLGQSRYSALQGMDVTSFNVPFQNSYTKKVVLRNFNYMMIKTYNNNAEDCSLSSISTIYKYNRESGGVK